MLSSQCAQTHNGRRTEGERGHYLFVVITPVEVHECMSIYLDPVVLLLENSCKIWLSFETDSWK